MLSWEHKKIKGSVMIHGHCHGKSRSKNKIQILKELRVDVGIDGKSS